LKSRRFVWDVAVQGDRAFIAARPNQAGKDRCPDGKVVPTGVWVVDVSDPRQPRESSFMPVSVLGVASSRLAVEVGPPQLAFLKDMLYVAEPDTSVRLSGDAYNDRLWVIDLRQPDQPRLRAMMHLAGQTRDVATDGRELYVADRSAGLLVLEPPAR
jgi:hypothetical protein